MLGSNWQMNWQLRQKKKQCGNKLNYSNKKAEKNLQSKKIKDYSNSQFAALEGLENRNNT